MADPVRTEDEDLSRRRPEDGRLDVADVIPVAGDRDLDEVRLLSALQRHLNYPTVPRRKPVDDAPHLLPQLQRRLEQLESRLKLLEEDQRGGIDITKFYERPPGTVPPPDHL